MLLLVGMVTEGDVISWHHCWLLNLKSIYQNTVASFLQEIQFVAKMTATDFLLLLHFVPVNL
jgi:hypothetical protein